MKKPDSKIKEKSFINIFRPHEGGLGQSNSIAIKKIPIKAIKRIAHHQKGKTIKFIGDSTYQPPGLLNDENSLLALNHLINYHYLLCNVSFRLRSQLTLSEDSLFAYTSYVCEDLEMQSHQIGVLKQIKSSIESNLLQVQEAVLDHYLPSAKASLNPPIAKISIQDKSKTDRLDSFLLARLSKTGKNLIILFRCCGRP